MAKSNIAFIVQAHVFDEQLAWLLSWLRDTGSTVILSFDGAAPTVPLDVIYKQSEPVCWGGYSIVSSFLNALEDCLGVADWDHVVNLSGTCFPLKPFSDLARFIHGFPDRRCSLIGANATGKPDLSHRAAFQQSRYLYSEMLKSRQVKILCQAELGSRFARIENSPVFDLRDRLNYHVEEIPEIKTLLIRALSRSEADTRANLLSKAPLHFGRAWYCLHRSAADEIVKAAASSATIELLKTAFVPDELFVPTLARGEIGFDHVLDRNLHWNGGGAEAIDAEQWTAAHRGDSFFIRKVNPWHFHEVLAVATGKI